MEMYHFSEKSLAELAGRVGVEITENDRTEISLVFDVVNRRRRPVLKLVAEKEDEITYQDLCALSSKWEPLFKNLVNTRDMIMRIRVRDIIEVSQEELLNRLKDPAQLEDIKTIELAKIMQSCGYTIEKTEGHDVFKMTFSESTATNAGDMNQHVASILTSSPELQRILLQQARDRMTAAQPPPEIQEAVVIDPAPAAAPASEVIVISSPDWGTEIGRPDK
jgi:hypothetical protein